MLRCRRQIEPEVDRGDIRAIMISLMTMHETLRRIEEAILEDEDGEEEADS
jgi:predicted ribonuclease toxin of YeeF-YezG toxin-antitoxin module